MEIPKKFVEETLTHPQQLVENHGNRKIAQVFRSRNYRTTGGNRMAQLIEKILEEVIQRIVEVAQPEKIILFGSAARGEMGRNSDIDLLVVKSGIPHRGRLTEAIYTNLFGVGFAVDVIVVTQEDIERYRDSIGLIIEPALREGEIIYDINTTPAR